MSNQVDYSDRAYDDLPPSLDGISAHDAARTLADRRWNKDETPVSDGTDLLTGHSAAENSAGYEPMQVAHDVKEAAAAELEPSDAAKEIASRKLVLEIERAGRPLDTRRDYYQQAGDDAGKAMPPNQTVSAEQAASDLTLNRQQEAEAAAKAENEELAKVIDQLRSYDPTQQQAQPEQPLQIPQPEVPPTQTDANNKVQRLLQENPELLNAMAAAEHQDKVQAEWERQQAAVAQEQYNQAIINNAQLTVANIQSRHPELRVPVENWGAVLQSLAQSNPQRAQAIAAELQGTRDYFAHAQQAQAQRQAAYQAEQQRRQQYRQLQWNHQAAESDRAYDIWAHQNLGGRSAEIKTEALSLLREDFGMTDESIARLWNEPGSMLRSFEGQKLLADAAQFRMAQRGAASKRDRSAPVVQKPGSPLQRGSEEEHSMRSLNDRIGRTSGREQIRAAAELIAARRAR